MVTDETLAQARAKWQGMGLSGGGAMFTPAISPLDPNLMMLNCDMSCAFRTDDGGRNWEMIHHHYLIASTQCRPVFHPTDPNTVFAVNGYGGELRVSHDRGVTWRPVSDALPRGVLRIAIDPAGGDLMLVGCYRGDLSSVSHDAGKTWARSSGLKGAVVGFHIDQTSPPGKRRCFAGTTEGVFVSDDAGATWRPIGDGLPNRRMLEFTGGSNASDGCVLYCTTQSEIAGGNFAGGVYRSTDGGRTWQQAMGAGIDTEGRQRWGAMRAPQYPFVLTTNVHPRTVYAVREAPGQVFRSDDAGDSWRPLLFVRLNDERFNTEPSYLTAETGGWEENMSGAGINPADPDTVILTDWMCCQITHDGGKTWQTLHSRPAPGQGPVGKGQRWENTGLTVTTIWHYYFDPFEKDRRYIAYTDIGYAWSDDAGKTWRWLHGRPLRNTTYEIAFDPDTPGKMWAAFSDVHDIPNANIILERHGTHGQGGVGVSEDFGVTWQDTSEGLPGSCVISVVLDPRSPKGRRTLYASVWEHGVYKSVDDGATWTSRSATRSARREHADLPTDPASRRHPLLPCDCAAGGRRVAPGRRGPVSLAGRRRHLGVDQPVVAFDVAKGFRRGPARQPRHLLGRGGRRWPAGGRAVQDDGRRRCLAANRQGRPRHLRRHRRSARPGSGVYVSGRGRAGARAVAEQGRGGDLEALLGPAVQKRAADRLRAG